MISFEEYLDKHYNYWSLSEPDQAEVLTKVTHWLLEEHRDKFDDKQLLVLKALKKSAIIRLQEEDIEKASEILKEVIKKVSN